MSRFPVPWTAASIPGGWIVHDASGRALAYVYGRETPGVHLGLTMDEARRIARGIARLPELLGQDRAR